MEIKRKILSIDDSATMRMMLKKAIVTLGFDFLDASDGMTGLDVLSKEVQNIDLILLDWNMPGMNGLEFLKTVKSNTLYRSIPIIMVTTEAEKDSVVKSLQYGVKNYILKPFTNEELSQKINQCVRGK